MPIYDYKCENKECEQVFEVLAKISDPAPSECPKCHAPDPRKQLAAADFRLKGKGWYATDYCDRGKKTYSGD